MDLATVLTSQCEHLRRLNDSHDRALCARRHRSVTHARFLRALTQLARYKMDRARADTGRAVCAAVDARRSNLSVGYKKLHLRHPCLAPSGIGDGGNGVGQDGAPAAGGDGLDVAAVSDAEGLLQRLADEAHAARARVASTDQALRDLGDLSTMNEEKWEHHALARDQALQDHAHLAALRLEGLRAKQGRLERAVKDVGNDTAASKPPPAGAFELGATADIPLPASSLPLPAPPMAEETSSAGTTLPPAPPTDGTAHASLLASCHEIVQCVREMDEACGGEARKQAAAIADRVAKDHRDRQSALSRALQVGAVELRAEQQAAGEANALLERRSRAEVRQRGTRHQGCGDAVLSSVVPLARHCSTPLRSCKCWLWKCARTFVKPNGNSKTAR